MGMGPRRTARECALQLLYQANAMPPELAPPVEAYWKSNFMQYLFSETTDLPPHSPFIPPKGTRLEEIRSYADYLYEGTLAHIEEIDHLIQRYSEHWRLERMAVVDRSILRIAVFEFLYEDGVPPTVVINEALEIARHFSTEESTQFVNGILDAINKNYLPNRS